MTRVLVVHQYMRPGSPQDQQRGPIYADLLAEAGMDVTFIGRQPLPGLFLSRLPARTARWIRGSLEYRALDRALAAATTAVNDRRIVREARSSNVVLLIKTDSPALVRRIRHSSQARLVYDLADVRRRHRPDLTRAVETILSMVDAVTCDNAVAMQWARAFNRSVHEWPSVSYIEAFDAERHLSGRGTSERVTLGWVGTPSTASNLYLILESLEDVFRSRGDLALRLVGIAGDHEILSRFEHVEASVRTSYGAREMVREVLQMDIGLFPMYDLLDSAMHGLTKALIYMAGGAAVVCSPVGDVRDLIREGENGLFASGRNEWTAKLDRLISDAALRERLVGAGRRSAACHSLERCFDRLRAVLEP